MIGRQDEMRMFDKSMSTESNQYSDNRPLVARGATDNLPTSPASAFSNFCGFVFSVQCKKQMDIPTCFERKSIKENHIWMRWPMQQ